MKKSFSFLASASIVLSGLVPATSFAADATYSITNTTSRSIQNTNTSFDNPINFGNVMTTGDFNGDGYQDIVISGKGDVSAFSKKAKVAIFYGPLNSNAMPSKISDADAIILPPSSSKTEFGAALAAGDINNDGYDELFIGDPTNDDDLSTIISSGSVFIQKGSRAKLSGTANVPQVKIQGTFDYAYLGSAIAVGDFNGDKKDDLAMGAPSFEATGQVFIIENSSSIFNKSTFYAENTTADSVLKGSKPSTSLYDEAGSTLFVNDMNNDGYDDLIVGASGKSYNTYLVQGKASSWGDSFKLASDSVVLENTDTISAFEIMDIDADGKKDLVLGDPAQEKVYIIRDIATRLNTITSYKIADIKNQEIVGDVNSDFGTSVKVLDFDNNGMMDLAVGAPTGDGSVVDTGYVSVFLNKNSKELRFQGTNSNDAFGATLHSMDVNVDGIVELIAAAPKFTISNTPGSSKGMVAALFECVDADKDSYCAAGIGVNSAGRGIDSNDADANSEKTTATIPTVVSLTAQNDGTVKITYSNSTTQTVDYFTKTKGVPTVQKLTKRNRYVVYHPKMKSAVAVDATFGDTLDTVKLSKKKFSKGKGKVKKVGSTQRFLFVQMKNKKSSRFVAVKLDGTGSDNFFLGKKGKNIDSILKIKKAPKVTKVKKGTFEVAVKDAEGTITYLLKKPTKKFTLKVQE